MNIRSYSTEYQYLLKWTIDSYSKLSGDWSEKSPAFVVEPQSNWHVLLKRHYLYIYWDNEKRFSNDIQVLVSNSKGEELYKKEFSYTNSETDVIDDFCYSNAIQKLQNDQIIFEISFKVWVFQSETMQVSNTPEIRQDHLHTLRIDLENILTNNIEADFTFKIQGQTLSAHKAILMARSAVFARMFQAGLKEQETNTASIEDVSVSAMKALLQFMYSAEVDDLDFDTALEVYVAADKYAVLDLKDVCSRVIASEVTLETATDALIFAKSHDDPVLRDSVMQYIALHYGSR